MIGFESLLRLVGDYHCRRLWLQTQLRRAVILGVQNMAIEGALSCITAAWEGLDLTKSYDFTDTETVYRDLMSAGLKRLTTHVTGAVAKWFKKPLCDSVNFIVTGGHREDVGDANSLPGTIMTMLSELAAGLKAKGRPTTSGGGVATWTRRLLLAAGIVDPRGHTAVPDGLKEVHQKSPASTIQRILDMLPTGTCPRRPGCGSPWS
jgi:hypothetical protein